MRRSLRTQLLLLGGWMVLVALATAPAAASAGDDGLGQVPDYAAIDAYVQRQMARSSIPGLAYAVVSDGQVVHRQAFGVAGPDGRPMTTGTPMYIASVGKTFTALAVRQLVSAGKLQLDAPVVRYLPWFQLADARAAKTMTVRHLLEHTSGLSTFAGNDVRLYRAGPTSTDLVRSLAHIGFNRPVGAGHEYSNLNYLILGLVIESVSGQSYEAYVQQHIFAPLDMRHSFVTEQPAEIPGMAAGYRFLFGIPVAVKVPHPQGQMAAGMHISTVDDMAHYLIAFADHGRYRDRSIVAPDAMPAVDDQIYSVDWEPVAHADRGFSPGQAGAWLNYSSGLMAMPSERMGVVVLANANPTQLLAPKSAFDITHDILRLSWKLPPTPDHWTLTSQYLVVDAILLAVAGFVTLRVVGLRGWQARQLRRRGRWLAGTTAAVVDLGTPLLILIGVPLGMAYAAGDPAAATLTNWNRLFFQIPDVACFAFSASLIWLVAGLLELGWMLQRRSAAIGATQPAAAPEPG